MILRRISRTRVRTFQTTSDRISQLANPKESTPQAGVVRRFYSEGSGMASSTRFKVTIDEIRRTLLKRLVAGNASPGDAEPEAQVAAVESMAKRPDVRDSRPE